MTNLNSGKWVKVDKRKINPLHHENKGGVAVSSSLAPQHVPKAFKLECTHKSLIISLSYESSLYDDSFEELIKVDTAFESMELSDAFKFYIGENSGKLFKIELSLAGIEALKAQKFKEVRDSLDEVKVAHPRWGTFTAASNMLKSYATSIVSDYTVYN